jgi:hypothetical protein
MHQANLKNTSKNNANLMLPAATPSKLRDGEAAKKPTTKNSKSATISTANLHLETLGDCIFCAVSMMPNEKS